MYRKSRFVNGKVLQTDANVLNMVRSYLSFHEICASRRVCKSFRDTSHVRVEHCVFFVEDGTPFNLPNSEHPEFRRCLESMILLNLHCEVTTQEHLEFLSKIIGNAKHVHLELDGSPADTFQSGKLPVRWRANSLCTLAPQARHIDVLFFNIQEQCVYLDFSCFPWLESFQSNVRIFVENYDNRPMKYFGYPIDFWSVSETTIAANAETVALQKDFQQGPDFVNFWQNWTPSNSPRLQFCSSDCEPFMELGKNEEGIVNLLLCNPFGLGDYELETIEYQMVLRHILNRFPQVSINFHDQCGQTVLKKWRDIARPIFKEFSLPYPDP